MPDLTSSTSFYSTHSQMPDHDLYFGNSQYAIFFRALGLLSNIYGTPVHHVLDLQDVADMLEQVGTDVEQYLGWMDEAAELERLENKVSHSRREFCNYGDASGNWRFLRYWELVSSPLHISVRMTNKASFIGLCVSCIHTTRSSATRSYQSTSERS